MRKPTHPAFIFFMTATIVVMTAATASARPAAAATEAGAAPTGITATGEPAAGALRLSLREAILMSLERNPDLAAARADADVAGAGEREARSSRLPRLVGEVGWHYSDNPGIAFGDKLTASEFTTDDFAIDRLNDPDPIGHGIAALQIEVPIDLSRRLASGVEAARGAAQAGAARAGGAQADLIAAVTETYHAVALARSAVGVAQAALANAEAHEASASARLDAGSALRSDRLRAQVERLARLRDLERRRADLEIARARLARLLELAPGESVEPAADLSAPQEPLGELDAWIDGAAAARPEAQAARRGVQAAEAALRAARSELRPDTVGSARYQRDTNELASGAGSYLVGVAIRWSAVDAGRSARIDAARARLAAAAARERSVNSAVRLEVETSFRDVVVAEHNLAAAREGTLAAEEARRITADRYAAGLLPLTDLLDTETALVAARLAELSALYDTVVGRVRLARAAGRMEVPR